MSSGDGGYGTSQQYFNPDFARPVANAFLPTLSTNATPGDVRPVLAATNSVPLNVIQGSGAVPSWQIGGRRTTKRFRNHKNNNGNYGFPINRRNASRKNRKNRKSRKSRKSN